ncbi:MAG TPA: hypothetical protein VL133_03020 [Devosia sp.]|nr:hypothetical protein [Devosia sp.]
MRILAHLLNSLMTTATLVLLAPVALIVLIAVGVVDLVAWAELHSQFGGDKAAYERAKSRQR